MCETCLFTIQISQSGTRPLTTASLRTLRAVGKLRPDQPFYILELWELWDISQEVTPAAIQLNPQSFGMLGIIIMMRLCEQVVIYEFLPSKHKTNVYYYSRRFLAAPAQ